jgi:hypothetical protein
MAGYTISTVHVPNTTSGTGFQIERNVDRFDKEMLARAFVLSPDWSRGTATASVRKYRDMEDYRKASAFNASYQLVKASQRE